MGVHPALLRLQFLRHQERHPGAEQPDDVGKQLRTHLHLSHLRLRHHPVHRFRKRSKLSLMQEVQADAAYFINTAAQQLRYASLEAFLARNDIIRLLAQYLIDLRCFDKRIAKEVLEALRALVDRSTEVFHANAHNTIIHIMERLYNVSAITENYREIHHNNKTLDALASALVTAIHNTYQENAEAVV
jgi:hypothetical protein